MNCLCCATSNEKYNAFCTCKYNVLTRTLQMVELGCDSAAILWEDGCKINNNILDSIGCILTGIADRRKYSQVLPFANMGIDGAASRNRGIRGNHCQESLNVLFAAARFVIGPEAVQHRGSSYIV